MPRRYPVHPLNRRRFLRLAAASGGYLLLTACRDNNSLPAATVTPVGLTPSPRVTVTAAPTEALALQDGNLTGSPTSGYPIMTQTPTPLTGYPVVSPSATVSVATATATLLAPTVTPTPYGTTVLYLPQVMKPLPTATPTLTLPPTPTVVPTPQPTNTPVPPPCLEPLGPPAESVPPFVGLHASADPQISNSERCLFVDLQPSLIKVLTFHPPEDIGLLAGAQPDARWIVRTFLEFGGRNITPAQFVEYTLSDTQRSLNILRGRDIVIELHNEPNLVMEGLTTAWADGAQFADWWLDVLQQYRAAFPADQWPGLRFIYPGLSPGGEIGNIRQAHISFLEQSRPAIEAADGLGMHLYWSDSYSQAESLAVLDDAIGRFPEKLIWITEASYNKGGISDAQRVSEYKQFISALKQRPAVQGVTFFVASASNPQFAPETWLDKDLAKPLSER